MNRLQTLLSIVLASCVVLAVWAADGAGPQWPGAAPMVTLSQQANGGRDHDFGCAIRSRHDASRPGCVRRQAPAVRNLL